MLRLYKVLYNGGDAMVYMLLTDGFEDIEAIEVLDILRRSGVSVKTVGVFGEKVTSSHGVTVLSDIGISDIKKSELEMLILPGGPGHTEYEKSQETIELINYAFQNGKYIAAICASPSVIGKMGLLEGKKFTCYPGFEEFCRGGIFTGKKAEADGLFITGKGPGAAADFGFMLAEILTDKATADSVKEQMQY